MIIKNHTKGKTPKTTKTIFHMRMLHHDQAQGHLIRQNRKQATKLVDPEK